jgi:aspartate oxidase
MEFIQFQPTSLHHSQAKSFLILKAVRGEGGRLLRPDGTRFMHAHDPRAKLAPRDAVACAIDFEMKKSGFDCEHSDISHQPKDFLLAHFPNIFTRCLEFGIDITRQPIPLVKAALPLPAWSDSQVIDSDALVVLSYDWDELRRFMWNYVGIVRSARAGQETRDLHFSRNYPVLAAVAEATVLTLQN